MNEGELYETLSALVVSGEELASERMAMSASIDEVEAKLSEIRDARAMLRRGGLRALRAMMQRGRASRSLRTFLEKVL